MRLSLYKLIHYQAEVETQKKSSQATLDKLREKNERSLLAQGDIFKSKLVVEYDKVGTSMEYDKVGTSREYDKVGTSMEYDKVGTSMSWIRTRWALLGRGVRQGGHF